MHSGDILSTIHKYFKGKTLRGWEGMFFPCFQYRPICSRHESRLEQYNHLLNYTNGLQNSFPYKNPVLNNKIFIVQKTKTYESFLRKFSQIFEDILQDSHCFFHSIFDASQIIFDENIPLSNQRKLPKHLCKMEKISSYLVYHFS